MGKYQYITDRNSLQVQGASFYGQLNGTAVGITPLAHLAIYRVRNGFGSCADSDILAGMDTAVEDGVDVCWEIRPEMY